jgi:hypothetical protein
MQCKLQLLLRMQQNVFWSCRRGLMIARHSMLPQHQNEPWDSGRYRANHTKYLANSGFRIVDPLGRSIPFRKIFTSGMPGPPDWARSLQPLRPKQAAYTSWWLKYEQRNPVEKLPLVIKSATAVNLIYQKLRMFAFWR